MHQLVLANSHGHFLYRGENSTEYELRPKYGRDIASTMENALAIEKNMLLNFMRRGAPHVDAPPKNQWEWLAVAQHSGLATRLLDWTKNPLVAAYFAVQDRDINDCVIYSLDENSIDDEVDEDQSPFEATKVLLYRPKHVATRIMAQTGHFTLHPNPAETFAPEKIERWIIKSAAVLRISLSLDHYGFNKSTMFPGLDGIAHHVNDWNSRGRRK